jgi:adenine-specific DNA-methyltransferase
MMLDLFERPQLQEPKTQGIKYAGAKTKLLSAIVEMVSSVNPKRVFDGFAGTTRVSQALALAGYEVIANDTAVWSKTFAECYLNSQRDKAHYQRIIDHLNSLPPIHGWFSEHYGGDALGGETSRGRDGLKKPFQMHNTTKLDAIRTEIDRLELDQDEKNVALTGLIMALEQVDSTLGHYVSYLNEWSPRSYKSMHLNVPRICQNNKSHKVYNTDTLSLTAEVEADVAYFDPPYGSNNEKMPPSRVRYSSYYHIWKTVILNDRPKLFGAACRREDSSDTVGGSVFEDFRRSLSGRFVVVEAIERLIQLTKSPNIILSYSSGGRATAQELTDILSANGEVIDVIKMSHKKNVMAHMKWTNDWLRDVDSEHIEYLFMLRKE